MVDGNKKSHAKVQITSEVIKVVFFLKQIRLQAAIIKQNLVTPSANESRPEQEWEAPSSGTSLSNNTRNTSGQQHPGSTGQVHPDPMCCHIVLSCVMSVH